MPNLTPPTPAEELLRGPIKSKTVFPALVLHMLDDGPEHGFGLMQRIERVCSGVLAVNTNTIYPLLRRLEERGFISGEWDHPTKRSRRMYSITPAGRERLARIKANMLPYLDHLAASVQRLRAELYGDSGDAALRLAGAAAPNGHVPNASSNGHAANGHSAAASLGGRPTTGQPAELHAVHASNGLDPAAPPTNHASTGHTATASLTGSAGTPPRRRSKSA